MTQYTSPDNIPVTDITDIIASSNENLRIRMNAIAAATQQGLNRVDQEATQGDVDTLQAAKDDATTKYGGLPQRMTDVEAKNTAQDGRLTVAEAELDAVGIVPNYVVNGSFRDGFTGWANTGAWAVETSTATSWARTTSGADGALTQSIIVPAHLLGKTVRLRVLAMTTSSGTLQTKVTTTAGDTALQHTLATGPFVEKALNVAIPAGQGTTPITLAVGRWSGTVFMTAIRLEAL